MLGTVSPDALRPLLDYLDTCATQGAHNWQDWRVTPITGGANNRVFRATGPQSDLAVKFTIRDERHRASREFAALSLMRTRLPGLAPEPVLLDLERYAHPLVVQTWITGVTQATAPVTESAWRAWIAHYTAIHGIQRGAADLRAVVLNMCSAADGLERCVAAQVNRVPPAQRSSALTALLDAAQQTVWPDWTERANDLCRGDPNVRNMIALPQGGFASVDWEYSGWGDGAFEIADMMAMPSNSEVTPARWRWVIAEYCARRGDAQAALRIKTYHALMQIWWVARSERTLYEIPRGLDQRLAAPPADWQSHARLRHVRALERAWDALPDR